VVYNYESLNKRFPIIDVVISHLSCNEAEKSSKNSLSLSTASASTMEKAKPTDNRLPQRSRPLPQIPAQAKRLFDHD
jgi:hypothetical protein